MKKITLFLSVLFMALVVKAQVTETYDFYNFATGDGYMTTTGDPIAIDAEGAATTQYFTEVYKVNNLTIGETTMDFNDRFAFNPVATGYQMYWRFRNTGTAHQKGLVGQWNSGKTANTTFNMSILGLYSGDKVAITYSIQNGKSANLHFVKSGIVTLDDGTAVASGDVMTSGKTYTVVAADDNSTVNLDLYVTDNNIGIHTVTIVSDKVAEGVDAPKCVVTGANNGNRTITITPATEGSAGTAVQGTYYTTDGTEPSMTNGTAYTAPFVISATSTIKAITYLTSGTVSDVTTLEVEAGETISLNSNIVDVTALSGEGDVKNAVVTNVYTSAGLIGTPNATVTCTFNGATVTLPYTVTEDGTLVATATAEGYESTTETLELKAAYMETRSVDFKAMEVTSENMTEVLGDGWTYTSDSRWASWKSGVAYPTAVRNSGFTFNGVLSAPGGGTITDKFNDGSLLRLLIGFGLGRNRTGDTKYTIHEPGEGEIALYVMDESYNNNDAKRAVEYVSAYVDDAEMSHTATGPLCIAKVSVYSPVRELVVEDGKDLNATGTYTSAIYTRTVNPDYNYGTICLPFAPDAETCENYTFYTLSAAAADALTFTEVETPEAYIPYLYSAKDKEATTHTFTGGETEVASDPESYTECGSWMFFGALSEEYIPVADMGQGMMYYAYKPTAEDGDVLVKATKSLEVKPYRAFFITYGIAEWGPDLLSTMRIVVRGAGDNGDGTTGIEEVITPDQIEGAVPAIYNLMGQPVAQPVKGQIYIVNGKKVVY